MKKKILFIIPNLRSGGAEKSLVTLLQLFDYNKYDVSLFLFRKEGLFVDSIPPRVKILTAGENYNYFDGSAAAGVKYFIKKGRIDLALSRILYAESFKISDSYSFEKKMWKYLSKSVKIPKGHFDCVIGYLEGTADWLAGEINATKKIGYMHSYLDNTPTDKRNFKETIEKFDSFVAVSQKCLDNLKELAPGYKGFCEINNIISPVFIRNAAGTKTPFNDEGFKILTIGRLSFEKGIDVAVEACRILKDKGNSFRWYHIGEGPEKGKIKSLINDYRLEENFILLGERSNPYPYINSCDIYAQPSRHEGKSIAIDEAKCLCRPIVVTNFPSVYDQIRNGVNGLICEMTAESLADCIEKLINDKALRDALSLNLSREKIGNEEEIQKLYNLIES